MTRRRVRWIALPGFRPAEPNGTVFPTMNISKVEQRVLHVLARGGRIEHRRDTDGRVAWVDCITREGWRLFDCDLVLFHRLPRRRLIASRDGRPYAISRRGLDVVRAQLDNR